MTNKSKTEIKLNPKQEIFAQGVAIGKSQENAYIDAGYSENGARINASKLLTNHNISARVQELQFSTAKRHELSIDSVIAELEKTRKMAMSLGHSHAAIVATMSKAKLAGLI